MDNGPIQISFDVEPMGSALPITVLLDGKIVWENLVEHKCNVQVSCQDDDSDHVLTLKLNGKLPSHTEIDADGNIVKDSTIKFSNFLSDDLEISQLILDSSVYLHNFNGNGPDTENKFYGEMGCNGEVNIKFSTPFYIWVLENI